VTEKYWGGKPSGRLLKK